MELIFKAVLVVAGSFFFYLAYQFLDFYRYDLKSLNGQGDFITVGTFFAGLFCAIIGLILFIGIFL